MELLDVTLTAIQRRNRAAFVHQADLPGRPLVPGQRVVLRDENGDYFAGAVVDRDGATGEERYVVHVGVRLPEEHAARRLGHVPRARSGADDDMDSLLDLLGEARQSLRSGLPTQRHG